MSRICMIVWQVVPQVDLYQIDDVGAVFLLHDGDVVVPPEIEINSLSCA